MTKGHTVPLHTDGTADAPALDARDATIERLERALADERQRSAALRETVEKLRFQAEVLEKSYSKQLADARERAQTAEHRVAALETRIAALDTSPEDAIQALAEARRQLDLVTAERDRLRGELARAGGGSATARAADRTDDEILDGTINRLLADSRRIREQQPAPPAELDASVAAEPDGPAEVMLDPELLFTPSAKSGERR